MFSSAHIHPMMVHFPIAIIAVGFLADILSLIIKKDTCLPKMAYYLEIAGMLGTIAAFGTGYFLTSPMEGETGAMREKHELFATITLIVIIFATCYRGMIIYLKKDESFHKYIALFLFFISFVFVSITGFLGGSLVLDYMIGI